jgi:hypothetical protein
MSMTAAVRPTTPGVHHITRRVSDFARARRLHPLPCWGAVASSARLALLTVVALTGACVPLPGGRSLSTQQVAAKVGENTLVSVDRATCRVADAVFARVQVGDDHRCVWQEEGRAGEAPRPGGVPTPRRAPALPGGPGAAPR